MGSRPPSQPRETNRLYRRARHGATVVLNPRFVRPAFDHSAAPLTPSRIRNHAAVRSRSTLDDCDLGISTFHWHVFHFVPQFSSSRSTPSSVHPGGRQRPSSALGNRLPMPVYGLTTPKMIFDLINRAVMNHRLSRCFVVLPNTAFFEARTICRTTVVNPRTGSARRRLIATPISRRVASSQPRRTLI